MTPLVDVQHLVKEFPVRRGLFGSRGVVRAVDGVSFSIDPGETFSLVGESGSGKTTTGRCVLRLVEPTAGTIRFRGVDLRGLSDADLRRERRHMQIVFQDPYTSLNPRMRAGRIVEEPLEIHGVGSPSERSARVQALFERVGLDPAHLRRYPSEFSGGQRQRICIARALAMEPELLIADEAVSALDVSVQAQVLALLAEIRARLDLAMLFITHDLRVAAQVCDHVAVMQEGRVVEYGPAREVFLAPRHEYTRALFAAAPGRGFAFGG
jgi:ABC-type glutathione transport system ATPase component